MSKVFGEIVRDGSDLQAIQTLLEDLNESGQDIYLVVGGYGVMLTKDGMPIKGCSNMTLQAACAKVQELHAEMVKHWGEIGGL